MGMKVGRIAIVSLRLVFIQIIGDPCLRESNSKVVEIGGCVIEEVGNWRWNTQYAFYEHREMCLLTIS